MHGAHIAVHLAVCLLWLASFLWFAAVMWLFTKTELRGACSTGESS